MNYIPADKLIAEIERRLKIVEHHKDTFESAAACRQELIWMKDFVTSLQQEQPEVDLEDDFLFDEVLNVFDSFKRQPPRDKETLDFLENLARHFYELGRNARKEE